MATTSGKKNGIATPGTRPVRRSQSVPRIAKIAQRLGSMIPTSELKAIPKDLSSQIDMTGHKGRPHVRWADRRVR